MGKQRKSRSKLSKDTSIDIMKPIPMDIIGTADDPCFGKLNNPSAEECGRCGDCELCAIVQSQKLHVKRDKVEGEQAFKDIQKLKATWKDLLRAMKKILPSGTLSHPQMKDKVVKKLRIAEWEYDKGYKGLTKKKVFSKYFVLNTNFIKRK